MPQAAHKTDPVEPVALRFEDDGTVPNNPTLPLLVYRRAIDVSGQNDPASRVERTFAQNGWGDSWRNGIYSFTHFHSMIHEALGVAAGRARVRFGGKAGEELEIEAGDVAGLPAGTRHQRLSAGRDFLLVRAYPAPGPHDLCPARPGGSQPAPTRPSPSRPFRRAIRSTARTGRGQSSGERRTDRRVGQAKRDPPPLFGGFRCAQPTLRRCPRRQGFAYIHKALFA